MRYSAVERIFAAVRQERTELTDEGRKLLGEGCDIFERLRQVLTSDQMRLHEQYMSSIEGYWLHENEVWFGEGFRLGLLIGIECGVE